MDKILEDPERVYRGRKDIHNEIYEKLKEKNLPEPEVKYKVYIREVATGFKLLGIDKSVVDPYIESLRCDFYEYIKNIVGTYIVDRVLYRHLGLQRVLSKVHEFEDAPYILFADFLVISKSNWVIEGKKKLNYEAIGKVLVYKHLLEMDYPELGDIKMGIACFESDKRLERICEELNIEVFVIYNRSLCHTNPYYAMWYDNNILVDGFIILFKWLFLTVIKDDFAEGMEDV